MSYVEDFRDSKMFGFVNKWIMRVKEARTVEVMLMWGVMTTISVLEFVRPYLGVVGMVATAISIGLFFGVLFPYMYDKLGIMKGEQQQRVRRKQNFVGEQMALNHLGLMHMFSEAFDKDLEEMEKKYSEFVSEHRDGVNLGKIEGGLNEG